jgi:hypothetical protein
MRVGNTNATEARDVAELIYTLGRCLCSASASPQPHSEYEFQGLHESSATEMRFGSNRAIRFSSFNSEDPWPESWEVPSSQAHTGDTPPLCVFASRDRATFNILTLCVRQDFHISVLLGEFMYMLLHNDHDAFSRCASRICTCWKIPRSTL